MTERKRPKYDQTAIVSQTLDTRRIRTLIYNEEIKWQQREAEYELWKYSNGGDLNIKIGDTEIHLEYINEMSDPVAVFRPQQLYSFYGEAKVEGRRYKVLVIIGTDEGLRFPFAPIEVGNIKWLRQVVKRKHYQQILKILPKEVV